MMQEYQQYQEEDPYQQAQTIPQLYASQKKIVDMLTVLIDCQSFLDDIEHKLRGEKLDYSKGQRGEYVSSGEPLMNDKGVQAIMSELSFRITPNFILTNFDLADVYRIAREFRLTMINTIFLNTHHYGIDPSRKTNVVLMLDHAVFAMLKRSQDKTTIKLLQETITKVESQITEQRPKRFNL